MLIFKFKSIVILKKSDFELIPPVSRNSSGIRDYTDEDCNWVHFMKCMRGPGLSIEVLIEYNQCFKKEALQLKQIMYGGLHNIMLVALVLLAIALVLNIGIQLKVKKK